MYEHGDYVQFLRSILKILHNAPEMRSEAGSIVDSIIESNMFLYTKLCAGLQAIDFHVEDWTGITISRQRLRRELLQELYAVGEKVDLFEWLCGILKDLAPRASAWLRLSQRSY